MKGKLIMNKEFKPYKRIFEDELEEELMSETCPEGSKPASGGACARIDKNGNLGAKIPNVCNIGHKFDSSAGKCIPHTDKK